ncbi:MAG: DUF2807 domain-containing protein [Brumimicrobium sp.]
MKKIILVFLISISLNGLSQETTEQKLSSFEELIIQGRFTVDIEYSSEMKAVAVEHSKEVDIENLSYTYSNKSLKIKYSGSLLDDVDLNITLYIPSFKYLEARNGTEIRVDKKFDFQNNNIGVKSVSGGKIAIHANTPRINAEISKGGSIRLSGVTEHLKAEVKTGGTIGAANLDAKKVDAKISFGGEIICKASEELDAQVTSGGTISYEGEPKVKEKIRLGGTIEQL